MLAQGSACHLNWQQESGTKLAGLSFHCEALRCDWGFLSLPCDNGKIFLPILYMVNLPTLHENYHTEHSENILFSRIKL